MVITVYVAMTTQHQNIETFPVFIPKTPSVKLNPWCPHTRSTGSDKAARKERRTLKTVRESLRSAGRRNMIIRNDTLFIQSFMASWTGKSVATRWRFNHSNHIQTFLQAFITIVEGPLITWEPEDTLITNHVTTMKTLCPTSGNRSTQSIDLGRTLLFVHDVWQLFSTLPYNNVHKYQSEIDKWKCVLTSHRFHKC